MEGEWHNVTIHPAGHTVYMSKTIHLFTQTTTWRLNAGSHTCARSEIKYIGVIWFNVIFPKILRYKYNYHGSVHTVLLKTVDWLTMACRVPPYLVDKANKVKFNIASALEETSVILKQNFDRWNSISPVVLLFAIWYFQVWFRKTTDCHTTLHCNGIIIAVNKAWLLKVRTRSTSGLNCKSVRTSPRSLMFLTLVSLEYIFFCLMYY